MSIGCFLRRSILAQNDIHKALRTSSRGGVNLPLRVRQREAALAERLGQALGIPAPDRQAGTPQRPAIAVEGGKDHRTATLHAVACDAHVRCLVGGLGQEMKCRSVVPNVNRCRSQLGLENVAALERDHGSLVLGHGCGAAFERLRADVMDGNSHRGRPLCRVQPNQALGQPRHAAAHVQDGLRGSCCVGPGKLRLYEVHGAHGVGLRPAERGAGLVACVLGVPVRGQARLRRCCQGACHACRAEQARDNCADSGG
mmetsp:Transcript_18710/g.71139  ORF Transcript_18710/g.71139 Transcript_18710/m.71139 type:complete len:256 (+) Transcript_18710:2035-2802(+)